MSNVAQMKDNLKYMRDFQPLNKEEQEINIPEIFSAMNLKLGNGQMEEAAEAYGKAAPEGHRASDCIACGQCETACPQHLPIIQNLRNAAEMFEG